MLFDQRFIYLIALTPFCIVWLFIFFKRKDLRQEMILMSLIIGVLSMITSYYWWTIDWWKPITMTGTIVGIEDFIMGFTTGGIMATIYEVIFKRKFYKRKLHHHITGGLTLLFLLAQTTMWFFWGVGLTSFWSGIISMSLIASIMLIVRKDLVKNAVLSGILMTLISLLFYYTVLIISPEWINNTYLSGLSNIHITGIPIEEYIFWFFAGLVFGPFYEYWQGERLRSA